MSKWEKVKLGEVCTINPSKKQAIYENKLVSFIPMTDVTEDGRINTNNKRLFSEVSSGFSYFIEDDVLFAKITPCMENGKGAIARGLINGLGVGSTEFHVLRPNKEFVISEWIFRIVSFAKFRKLAEKHMTGSAGQKRVPKSFLENAIIPLPPIETQKKITKTLDTVAELLAMRKQQLTELDHLIKSIFYEMFGDPFVNEKGWTTRQLSRCSYINPKKSEIDYFTDDFEVSFVPMQSVSEHGEINTSETRTYGEVKTGFTYFYENDVLFAKITPCMENGKGAIARNLKNSIGFGSTEFHVLRPIEGVSNSEWIYQLTVLPLFRKYAEKNMTGSAGQKRVPISFFDKLLVPVPPIELQNQFAEIVTKIEEQKALVKQAIDETQYLLDSLMSEYFE